MHLAGNNREGGRALLLWWAGHRYFWPSGTRRCLMRTRSPQLQSPLRGPLSTHCLLRISMQDDINSLSIGPGGAAEHVVVALFAPISAQILCFVDPSKVRWVFKEQKGYKLKKKWKEGKVPTLHVTPYKVSVEREILKQLRFMVCFNGIDPTATVELLTNSHNKEMFQGLMHSGNEIVDSVRLCKALPGFRFPEILLALWHAYKRTMPMVCKDLRRLDKENVKPKSSIINWSFAGMGAIKDFEERYKRAR